jgi:hypothetical protein
VRVCVCVRVKCILSYPYSHTHTHTYSPPVPHQPRQRSQEPAHAPRNVQGVELQLVPENELHSNAGQDREGKCVCSAWSVCSLVWSVWSVWSVCSLVWSVSSLVWSGVWSVECGVWCSRLMGSRCLSVCDIFTLCAHTYTTICPRTPTKHPTIAPAHAIQQYNTPTTEPTAGQQGRSAQ